MILVMRVFTKDYTTDSTECFYQVVDNDNDSCSEYASLSHLLSIEEDLLGWSFDPRGYSEDEVIAKYNNLRDFYDNVMLDLPEEFL